jgi:tRNA (guanine-N7-)-methyltransferase
MPKKKLIHFAENRTFANFFQPTYHELHEHGFQYKGIWARDFFRNDHPLVLELGCGKGEYTVGLAQRFPDKNYIGLDIKGARIWRGCKTAVDNGMPNVAFIRSRIELIGEFFGPGEVSEIWLPFPDPQPKTPYIKKRLVSPSFLHRYSGILNTKHIIHLKTDNLPLFEYAMEVIDEGGHSLLFATHDLYHTAENEVAAGIRTFYEEMFLKNGMKINYMRFQLKM